MVPSLPRRRCAQCRSAYRCTARVISTVPHSTTRERHATGNTRESCPQSRTSLKPGARQHGRAAGRHDTGCTHHPPPIRERDIAGCCRLHGARCPSSRAVEAGTLVSGPRPDCTHFQALATRVYRRSFTPGWRLTHLVAKGRLAFYASGC